MAKWISVEDRLPPDLEKVVLWRHVHGMAHNLFHDLYEGSGFGWYSKSYGWYAGDNGADTCQKRGDLSVTHWLPLPDDPPQLGGGDG